MSNFAKFRERFSSSSKKKEETSSETPAASAKFADDAKRPRLISFDDK